VLKIKKPTRFSPVGSQSLASNENQRSSTQTPTWPARFRPLRVRMSEATCMREAVWHEGRMLQVLFHAWERHLADVTKDRVVRPFDWGLDWIPTNGHRPDAEPAHVIGDWVSGVM